MEDMFGPWSDEFKGQGHQGQKQHFSALLVACMRFIFGKTSLASSFVYFCDITTFVVLTCSKKAFVFIVNMIVSLFLLVRIILVLTS